jgi:signal transduction histidine kinase/CheY-like chemotaxis protein
MKPRRLLILVALVDALALVSLVALFGERVQDPWAGTFLLATLIALAGATPVRVPGIKSSVTVTEPFMLTALAAYGPFPACLVATAGVLGSMLGRSSRGRPVNVAFNLGNVVCSTALASVAYLTIGGVPGTPFGAQAFPMVVATTVFFLVNTGLVSAAVALDTGRSITATWRASSLWMAVSTYASLPIAAGLLYLLEIAGPSGLALGVPPCWLLAAFYRSHRQRQEQQQNRILMVEEQNQVLEDKVAERTQELQQALSGIEQVNVRLRHANERLTEANRAKSEFLANVSHELRTPLNAIIGFSELLQDEKTGGLSDQQDEFVRDIHESGEHLLRLINGILDLSKIEAGKMEVHRERFAIADVVQEAVAMVTPQASQKSLRLETDREDEVGQVHLDPGMCRQILLNLLSNAVKFTPSDGRVRVGLVRDGRDLTIHVSDTGIGIGPEDVKRIFEEFYQVDGSYSRTHGGTGLGLALVRKMVEMQDGTIEVESAPREGTRVSLRFPGVILGTLPARTSDAPATQVADLPPATSESAEQGWVVLLVEDNPVNRKLARNVLRSHGFVVWEAPTGEAALTMLRRQRPDLILMDLQLPGMDGLEVTRRVKADPRTADLPVVALTAHVREADESRAREAGCVGYITKPIRLASFPGQVETFLIEPVARTG